MESTSRSESAVLALTREIPNYAEKLAEALECPITELWSVVLASSGRMTYVNAGSGDDAAVTLGVVDAKVLGGTTRLRLWRDALRMVVDIFGDPEARYRTGSNTRELRVAIDDVFHLG